MDKKRNILNIKYNPQDSEERKKPKKEMYSANDNKDNVRISKNCSQDVDW